MNVFYKLGCLAALHKLSSERVDVVHEGETNYQTPQRQAASHLLMRPDGEDTEDVWEEFDKRINNPADTSFHMRFVGP